MPSRGVSISCCLFRVQPRFFLKDSHFLSLAIAGGGHAPQAEGLRSAAHDTPGVEGVAPMVASILQQVDFVGVERARM
jgi:hypothetical protein